MATLAAALAWLAACAEGARETPPVTQASANAGPTPSLGAETPKETESPLGSYLAGRLARRERDMAAAAHYFSRALAADPDNVNLLRQTYLALHAEGRMDEAMELARRLIEAKASEPLGGLVLAVEAVRSGDFDTAASRLEEVPARGYNGLAVPLLKAWAAVGQGRWGAAREVLGTLDRNDTFAAFRDFHAGLIDDLAGKTEAADEAYRSAAAAQPGGSYRVVAALGSFYQRYDRPEAARRVYERYLAEHPDSVWFDAAVARLEGGRPGEPLVADARAGAAEALFGIASAIYQENALDAALLYLRLALHLRPGLDAANLLVGQILEAQGRHAEALAAYEALPPDSPLHWSARLRMAANLGELERTGEALAGLRAMAAERPERADALIALGDLLRSRERWTEAAEAYSEALARVDELEERHWRPLYARGIAFERSQQWARAEKDLLKALELKADQAFVLNYLGYSWVDQGLNLERALKMIERAVELRPNDGYIVDSLGWALYKLGRFEEAVDELERAVELRPDDPTINDHLGDAYWRVGRRIEARFQWRQALSLEPEEEDMIAEIREKLRKGLAPRAVADGDG